MWTAKPLTPYVENELKILLMQESSWALEMRHKILQAWAHCASGLQEACAGETVDCNALQLSFHLGVCREEQLRKQIVGRVQALGESPSVQAMQHALNLPGLQAQWVVGQAPPKFEAGAQQPEWLYQQFMQLMVAANLCTEYLSCLMMTCTSGLLENTRRKSRFI